MRQFDVFRLRKGVLIVVLQHDYLSELRSRLVAPILFHLYLPAITKIHVAVEFEGKNGLVLMDQITAVPKAELGRTLGSLSEHEYELKNAIDRMFIGY